MATDEQSLPLVIKVMEGTLAKSPLQAGQPDGQISLAGRMLPYRPIVFEGTQRVKTTWYPGNPKGRQQVTGPTELPTTITGVWKDRYIGDGQTMALARLFEDVRRRAPLLEVSWGAGVLTVAGTDQVGDPFTRQGILQRTKFSFDIPGRCAWEMVFEWNGLEDLTSAPVTATGVLNAGQGLDGVVGALDELRANVAAFRHLTQTALVGEPARLAALMDDGLSAVDDAADAVQGAAAAAARVAQFQAAVPVMGTLSNAVTAAQSLGTLVELLDPSRMVASDGALELLEFRCNVLVMLGKSRDAAAAAAQAADSVGQAAGAPDILEEVRAPAGTDLRDLAIRYYDGDPDGWVDIANENGFPTSRVPYPPTGASDSAGEPIRIPRRRAGGGLAEGC